MVVHGLRSEVGNETFFRILKSWTETYGGGNASTDDFVEHASKTAARDLTDFFATWLFSPVTPEIAALESEPEPGDEGKERREGAGRRSGVPPR